jgi:hypothetical protein
MRATQAGESRSLTASRTFLELVRSLATFWPFHAEQGRVSVLGTLTQVTAALRPWVVYTWAPGLLTPALGTFAEPRLAGTGVASSVSPASLQALLPLRSAFQGEPQAITLFWFSSFSPG